LKEYSVNYKNVFSVDELAKGGEAAVFRLEHEDLDEIVVKCSLFSGETSRDEALHAYDSIFRET
jgi:hypothetical protein